MKIEFNEESLCNILYKGLDKIKEFEEIVSIVKANSEGDVYLIGGGVSRTLVGEIYGENQRNYDFDFVVDNLREELEVPEGWTVSYHKFGGRNTNFKKGEIEIDMFPFSDHWYIKRNNLEPTLENFLDGVPFSIQSLALDIRKKRLVGKYGIEALKNREFKVHNVESAKEIARIKGVSINERMLQKAKSMGFEMVPFGDTL